MVKIECLAPALFVWTRKQNSVENINEFGIVISTGVLISSQVLVNYGDLCIELADFEKARELLERALQILERVHGKDLRWHQNLWFIIQNDALMNF